MLPVGTVAGHRGAKGEVTVRVPAGDASLWQGLERVHVGGRAYAVEQARAYRDRLVLKLHGVDDADSAERLRGAPVAATAEDAPELEEGSHYATRLVGMTVEDDGGALLGRVLDVMPTGGVDLLVVTPGGDDAPGELLIPMAREIVVAVDEERRRIRVRLPAGLLELNRS